MRIEWASRFRARSRSAVAAGVLTLVLAGPAWSPVAGAPPGPGVIVDPPDAGAAAVISRYQLRIPQLMTEQDIPGLAIAVVDGDHAIWAEGFGSTDRDGRTPITPDTIFSVQSMSKLFTATAVMQAVGKGLLDLDVPITTYLPDFTVHSAFEAHPEQKITLRMLLSHTAGFTHEAPVGNNYDGDWAEYDTHVRSISDTWLRFPVGTGYAYSNLGIDLAGAILERVRGEPFPALMRDSLLDPLGMDGSTFDPAEILARTNRAIGHIRYVPDVPAILPMTEAGGLYTSAADLARFLAFQLGNGSVDGNEVLSPALIAEMRTVPAPHAGALAGYALGVARTHWRAGRYLDLFSHGGGGFGFIADLWWLPQLQLGIAVVTNSDSHELQGDLALSVLRDLVSEPGSVLRQRLLDQPPQADVIEPDGHWLPPDDLDATVAAAAMTPRGDEAGRWASYAGSYRMPSGGVINPFLPPDRFFVDDGTPTFDDWEDESLARHPLVEVQPGVFLADNGETLDLAGSPPRWRSVALVRTDGGPTMGAVLLLIASVAAAVAWILATLWALIRRRRHRDVDGGTGATRRWRLALGLLATLTAVLLIAGSVLVTAVPGLVDTGFLGWLLLPTPLRLMLHLPLAIAIAASALTVLVAAAWARGRWSPARDPWLALLVVAAVGLTAQLALWRLIGWGLT